MLMDRFTLSGQAIPVDPERMLCEICEHFVEHSEVKRDGDHVNLASEVGEANIRKQGGCLSIDISCPSAQLLQLVRSSIAEHLFMFAGEEPLELNWHDEAVLTPIPGLTEIRVVAARHVTPHMRRLTLACDDVARFVGADYHIRLLIPKKGRKPVWPVTRADGRLGWLNGEDEMVIRIYTIRSVDVVRGEMDIDFVLHESDGRPMPGAEFGRHAEPGDVAGLLGPGGGGLPDARHMILAGDDTALPAISRILAEAPADARLQVFIEVDDVADQLPLCSSASVEITWLHRKGIAPGKAGILGSVVLPVIEQAGPDTYIWIGCEKSEARPIRNHLKSRGHDKKRMCVIGYWGENKH